MSGDNGLVTQGLPVMGKNWKIIDGGSYGKMTGVNTIDEEAKIAVMVFFIIYFS